MSRNTLNFLVDLVLALCLSVLVATGLVLRFVLPPGSGPRSVWTLRRHDWGGVHFWLGAALCLLLVVHIALHWQWACTTTRRLVRAPRSDVAPGSGLVRNLVGVVLLAVVATGLAVFTGAARSSIQPGTRQSGTVRPRTGPATRPAHEELRSTQVRGSMTLAQAAALSGVSPGVLRERLGLPPDASPNERLDRLGRQFGFNITAVRRALAELRQEAQEKALPLP